MNRVHSIRTECGASLRQRADLERRHLQATAAHVDAEHTALRAFGPYPPLAPIPDGDLIELFTREFEPCAGMPGPSLRVVDQLPACERCGPEVLARYAVLLHLQDGRVMDATLCTACQHARARRRASILTADRLVLLAEVPAVVRDQVEACASQVGLPSPWVEEDLGPEWMRNYRACGFAGPDAHGEMTREILGESVSATSGAQGIINLNSSYRDRVHTYTSIDNYLVPVTWTEAQIMHLLRQIFPFSRRTGSYPLLEDPLLAAEERLHRAMDCDDLPETLLDDVAEEARASVRLPNGPSLTMHDARRCAKTSRNTALLTRLVIEHPSSTVRRTARRRLDQLHAGLRNYGDLCVTDGFVEQAWIPWNHAHPGWAVGPVTTRRWRFEAGLHGALFSLDCDPEKLWVEALWSRPTRP